MAEKTLALVRDNTVVNVIVVDDSTPEDFLDQLQAIEPHDRTVDLAELTHPISPGFVYKRGRGYVPPIELDVEVEAPAADGTAAVVVTYADHRPDAAGSEVPVVVGGESHVVVLDEHGAASVRVHAATVDDDGTVVVEAGDRETRTPPPARPKK